MDIKKLMTLHPEIGRMADYEEVWWNSAEECQIQSGRKSKRERL